MRGVGDFGRDAAGFGGDGGQSLDHAGTDGGAARRDRDASSAGAGLGGKTRGGAGDPQGQDGRSQDFRRRLSGALDGYDPKRRASSEGHGHGDAEGHDDAAIPSGAAGFLALFQSAPSTARSTSGTAQPDGRIGPATGERRTASPADADPPAGDPLGAACETVTSALAAEPRGLRVLAASEPSPDVTAAAWFAQPAQDRVIPNAETGPDGRPGTARTERIAARIEEAIRADAAPTGPITIAIPIDPGLDGLVGLSVTVTPAGLDVVLDRSPGATMSAGLAEAAQDLVGRLQKRFPRVSLRVLETVGPDRAAADPGPTGAGWTST